MKHRINVPSLADKDALLVKRNQRLDEAMSIMAAETDPGKFAQIQADTDKSVRASQLLRQSNKQYKQCRQSPW